MTVQTRSQPHTAPPTPDGADLVIAHASAASDAAAAALSTLQLPQLDRLLGLLSPAERYGDDEYSLSATHEQVLAADLGWSGEPGHWPFAARSARLDGLIDTDPADDRPWGLVTPCHWLVSNDKISLVDPQSLALTEPESRALHAVLSPSFEAEGWTLLWGAPLRWYARHPVLAELRTASLDRVIGRNLDLWLRGGDPVARRLRRLQVEAQMLWHEHPVNEAREERGELTVNSFWLSGGGPAQADVPNGLPVMDERLRAPLLADDWAAWCAAWQALDAGPVSALLARARSGEAVTLTLCGERVAQRYRSGPAGLWQRLARSVGAQPRADARAVLAAL